MAFGICIKSIKTAKEYTIVEFYEAIKDKEFSAGKPSLYEGSGEDKTIVFPALDDFNQVWINVGGLKSSTNKFVVQKCEEIYYFKANAHLDPEERSNKGVFGKNVKACEKLVKATAKELTDMGL